MEKRTIAVVGATGAQGSGLVRAILADPERVFAVRALTRDPASANAQELAARGAEVVAADIDDEGSMQKAFAGAYGAYCVTFFWAHLSPERELAEAANMARTAQQAGLQHVIWSTLEDTRKWVPLDDARMPTLQGKYKVPHFDAKGEANQIFTDVGVPTTFLLTSFYWDNFIHFGLGPRRGPDGKLGLALPVGDARLAGIAAEDIGKCAYGIFKRGAEFIGKTVGIAGEHLTLAQISAALSQALGQEVLPRPITPDEYRTLGFPGAEDMANMFQFYRDFEEYFCSVRNPAFARSLNPELQDFAAWLAANKDAIPLD